MTTWPPPRGALARPAYRSLAQALARAIGDGAFRPGDRLPTHRELAYDLGLSVQTVSRAYEELTRLDIVAGEVGRGSFVRAAPPEARTPWQRLNGADRVIDCSMLTPASAPLHRERMAVALEGIARDLPADALLSFRPRATLARHCRVALDWLARCGLRTRSDLVIPTNGATPAMTVALMAAAGPGDTVLTGELCHHTLPMLTRSLGMRLAGLETDAEGVLPDAFARACMAGRVRVLYVVPNGLNPLARVMGAARRAAICAVARRFDVLIVENDAGGPLAPGRPPPLAALAPERVFYFTSFTKCLMPGMRFGYLVAPETLASATMNRHLVTNWMATPLMAEIASRWIEDGVAVELLLWQRAAMAARNRLAARLLGDIPHAGSAHGLHVWMPLEQAWSEEAFVAHARHRGVAVAAGAAFSLGEPVRHRGVRVCLGAAGEADLERGLAVLARLMREQPEPALLAV